MHIFMQCSILKFNFNFTESIEELLKDLDDSQHSAEHCVEGLEYQNQVFLSNMTNFMKQMFEAIGCNNKLFDEMLQRMQKTQDTAEEFLEVEGSDKLKILEEELSRNSLYEKDNAIEESSINQSTNIKTIQQLKT